MVGNLMRDKITLVRADGEVVREGIPASVKLCGTGKGCRR